jgi:glutathione synthase/RimK-type ligase-like ATP-grasp enzyme
VPTKVLLTGAGGSAAANFLASLRKAAHPYRVIGVDASPVRLHLSNADERYVLPRADDARFAEKLAAAIKATSADILHPQPDPDVLAIGAIRDELGAATYLPSQEALRLASDKSAFAAMMSTNGVATPESAHFKDLSAVGTVTESLLERCERVWVRARRGAGSRASLPVSNASQAVAWVQWWIEEKGLAASDFMVAEFLPGREFAYQSVWQEGELVAGQARQRVEYLYGHLTPHGQTSTPSVARTVLEPHVDELAIRAIRVLDEVPRGAYCVDIKEGSDRKPRVTEINAGRFFTTSNFFSTAGLNMPDMLMRCALGEKPDRLGTSPLEPDLYWIRMVDMGYTLVPGNQLADWPAFDRD